MIKSKFRTGYIIFFSITVPFVSCVMLFGFLVLICPDATAPATLLILLLFLSFWTYLLFKDCKSVTIDKQHGYLRWTSLFRPQGKIIDFSDLKSYVRIEERSKFETRSVIFLINKKRHVVLKIHGIFCKNVNELVEGLDLPEETNFEEDFFTGKIRLK